MINFSFTEPTFKSRVNRLQISQTIYDANVFDIKNWRGNSQNDLDMLPDTIAKFLNLLGEMEISYAIVGGIAYLAYIEDRNTKDLDVLISVKELDKILPFVKVIDSDANFTNAEFEGLRVDFLKTSNSLFDYIKENETTDYEFTEGRFPIATIAGLILMRFDAIIDLYQKGNFNKILRYENDLQFLTINHDVDWNRIWKISEAHFTDGQIKEFKKMVSGWQKPRRNPFEN